MSARVLCCLKVESLWYSFAAHLSLFEFLGELRKSYYLCIKVWYGLSRSSKVIDFSDIRNNIDYVTLLLLINSNLGRISHTVLQIRRIID